MVKVQKIVDLFNHVSFSSVRPVILVGLEFQYRSIIGKLGYRSPTTFFLQMFMIEFYCRKVLF